MTLQKNSVFVGKPGMLPSKPDQRTLELANYLHLDMFQPLPRQVDWTVKKTTPWGDMNNFTVSDCTCAAAADMIECWTANAKAACTIDDQAVMTAFIALTGYDAATGKNDDAVELSEALKYWRKTGIGNHKIKAYAIIDHENRDLLKAALNIFGGIYAGLSLPNSCRGQVLWDVAPGELSSDVAPGSFGGHVVAILAYDDLHVTCISWGKVKKMSWAFLDLYGVELHAILTEDFLSQNKTPLGFNVTALEMDLKKITSIEDRIGMAAGQAGSKGGISGFEAGLSGTKGG